MPPPLDGPSPVQPPPAATVPIAVKPCRVACCVTTLEPGGAEKALVELALGLRQRGYTIRFFVLSKPPPAGKEMLLSRLTSHEIEVEFLGLTGIASAGAALSRLSAALRTFQPEVLQAFLFHANIAAGWAGSRAGVPVVIAGVRVVDRRRSAWWRSWLEWLMRDAFACQVCVSQAVARDLEQRLGIPADRVRVIPNGVDVARFALAEPIDLAALGVAAGQRLVTAIGRLDPQKGLDELLEMSAIWLPQQPGHDLVLVGDGPLAEGLAQRAEQLGIGQRVHFVGWRSDVPQILAASDVIVLASRFEGLPNVVLEAMAAGKPVVATAVEGVCELLGDGAAEQSCPLDDAEGWIALLTKILGDAELAARLGRANQARAREHFRWEAMVDRYAELYADLLTKSR